MLHGCDLDPKRPRAQQLRQRGGMTPTCGVAVSGNLVARVTWNPLSRSRGTHSSASIPVPVWQLAAGAWPHYVAIHGALKVRVGKLSRLTLLGAPLAWLLEPRNGQGARRRPC